jgi:hypothetical protein
MSTTRRSRNKSYGKPKIRAAAGTGGGGGGGGGSPAATLAGLVSAPISCASIARPSAAGSRFRSTHPTGPGQTESRHLRLSHRPARRQRHREARAAAGGEVRAHEGDRLVDLHQPGGGERQGSPGRARQREIVGAVVGAFEHDGGACERAGDLHRAVGQVDPLQRLAYVAGRGERRPGGHDRVDAAGRAADFGKGRDDGRHRVSLAR